MAVTVLIPTPLRRYTEDNTEVSAEPGTISGVIASLDGKYPGIAARITDDAGEVRRFVNIYLNEQDVRFLSGKETPVKDGDTVSIVPAIAGGVGCLTRNL
ncbi:MAG: MoaD/ThiS family protein [Armatimonadetes bacterium]|nr:MoaD/ThiS family protein [Armatimonadota bacterium]MDE2205321.1 MoaD/ThiS family protein [Armatimonadota bacterium]